MNSLRRVFLLFLLSSTAWAALPAPAAAEEPRPADGELLYNGIRLPREWPPRFTATSKADVRRPRPVPYLEHPPALIPIDVGRQLFVDDFLIKHTTFTRQFHYPERYAGNPVLKPETELELDHGAHSCATPFQDGVWFDPSDQLFKLWYHAGWFQGTALATSKDGLRWERPALDVVPGTNRVLPVSGHGARDGCAVWLDPTATDPEQRFKMFVYERPEEKFGGRVFVSPDGIHWSGGTRTPKVGDNTSIFYNPFRKKWVYSIRSHFWGRAREYREHDDLLAGAQWDKNRDVVHWAGADDLDLPDPRILALMPKPEVIEQEASRTGKKYADLVQETRFNYGDPPQLYNLDATPYESLMLGVFSILKGPHNDVCRKLKLPKITDLELAYSRDGFHWSRPDRTPFLGCTHKEGDWERAYLHSAASICCVVGDKLHFYYGGWPGESPKFKSDTYAGGSTGVAMLRRDGFASMDADANGGELTTALVTFSGKFPFVNLAASDGELRAEILDAEERVIPPFSVENSVRVKADSTRQRLTWSTAPDLSALAGKPVRFRFHLTSGQLYAFWVSAEPNGASHGYVAAGGPGLSGPIDK